MLRQELARRVSDVLDKLIASGDLPEAARVSFEILDTKNPEHGDYSCNIALIAAKPASLSPRIVGEKFQKALSSDDAFASVDLAGPGFLNFKLKPETISSYVSKVLDLGEKLPSALNTQHSILPKLEVEFVSVNPNGPITVGSGRGAAFGDTLSRILQAGGNAVTREYYINDGVNSEQMRLFAESVRAYANGQPLPDNGYKGEYVVDVAKEVVESHPDAAGKDKDWFQSISQDLMIERQRGDLHLFGIDFDIWFSEQKDLHDKNKVSEGLKWLEANGNAYWAVKPENAGVTEETEAKAKPEDDEDEVSDGKPALWLRSSVLGDAKDRVLLRADGRPTYLAAEVGYLKDKFDRGYEKCFLILGPDHHGYIGRTYAVVKALGKEPVKDFEIVIFQIVRFVKDGQPAPMRKRDGNIYELRDLINELGEAVSPKASKEEQQVVGRDVSRFFYLMRSHETHMDFDIDLATKQSDDNPVFYAQYAHARICGVLRKAEEAGVGRSALGVRSDQTSLLVHPRELTLIKKILDLPEEVQRCAKDYGVHRIATYAIELARTFHHFYDACRVIQPDERELSEARILLVQSARIALKSALSLLGVSAPEKMERSEALSAER